jgi:hypothetical protein
MQPVERNEILKIGEYETVREPFRARVIAEKKLRRVALGPNATCVFENHDTVLLQIQEMIRTERITREPSILHEMETYNQLIPGKDELSATIMLEIDERETREKFLTDASGIEAKIALLVDGERQPATWDPSRILPGRASAVLYLKFPLTAKAAAGIRAKTAKIEISVDHAAYTARTLIDKPTAFSLAEDLDG